MIEAMTNALNFSVMIIIFLWILLTSSIVKLEAVQEYCIVEKDDPFYSVKENCKKSSRKLLDMSDYHRKYEFDQSKVHIGNNQYIVIKKMAVGGDAVIYLAKAPNGAQVVIKIFYNQTGSKESYDLELNALIKLDRLIDYDQDHLAIVQTKIEGKSFDSIMHQYTREKVGGDHDYPSNHIPMHLKQKYYEVLYKFRNATDMVHNDFRPYNIIGGTVIDFSRAEMLSDDASVRQKQIEKDDEAAEAEWKWYFSWSDLDAIERNPFLPNSLEHSYLLWDEYMVRYFETAKENNKYRVAWMSVLHYNIETASASRQFPEENDFY